MNGRLDVVGGRENSGRKRGRGEVSSPVSSNSLGRDYFVPGYFVEKHMLGEDIEGRWLKEDAWIAYSQRSFQRNEGEPSETQQDNILLALKDENEKKAAVCKEIILSQANLSQMSLQWQYRFVEESNFTAGRRSRSEPWVIKHVYRTEMMSGKAKKGKKRGIIVETHVYDAQGGRFFAVDYAKHGMAQDVHGHRWMADDGHGAEHFMGETIPWFWMAIPLDIEYPEDVVEFKMQLALNDTDYVHVTLPDIQDTEEEVSSTDMGSEDAEEELSEPEDYDLHRGKKAKVVHFGSSLFSSNQASAIVARDEVGVLPSSPMSHAATEYLTSSPGVKGGRAELSSGASSPVGFFSPVAHSGAGEWTENVGSDRRLNA